MVYHDPVVKTAVNATDCVNDSQQQTMTNSAKYLPIKRVRTGFNILLFWTV